MLNLGVFSWSGVLCQGCYSFGVTPGVLLLEYYSCDTFSYALSVIHPGCCNYITTTGVLLLKCVAIDVLLLKYCSSSVTTRVLLLKGYQQSVTTKGLPTECYY